MGKERDIVLFRAFWFLTAALAIILALRLAQPVPSQPQLSVGRFTERSAIEQAIPILQAILLERNDLLVTAYPGYTEPVFGSRRRLWNVNCLDSQGNILIRITRVADTGIICQASYDWHRSSVRSHPISLSSQDAVAESQRWMRILGFQARWHLVGTPRHRVGQGVVADARWLVTLGSPGWHAHVALDEESGTLM